MLDIVNSDATQERARNLNALFAGKQIADTYTPGALPQQGKHVRPLRDHYTHRYRHRRKRRYAGARHLRLRPLRERNHRQRRRNTNSK